MPNDVNAFDPAQRVKLCKRHRKDELEVFATVQCDHRRRHPQLLCHAVSLYVYRQTIFVDTHPDTTLLGEMEKL